MLLQGFSSPPVQLNLKDLKLDRTAAAPAAKARPAALSSLPNGHVANPSIGESALSLGLSLLPGPDVLLTMMISTQ